MLLKINSDIINMGDIDSERKAKTIENIRESEGDFSYAFSIPNITKHRKALGINPLSVDDYNPTQEAELLSHSGIVVRKGNVVIEDIDDNEITLYFISGNSSASEILSDSLIEFDFLESATAITTTNIQASWDNDSGVVFPLINSGLLEGRVNNSTFEVEDFHPFIYVKTLIQKILSRKGIKLTGEILLDGIYNNLLVTSKSTDATQRQINLRSVNAGVATTQSTTSGGDGDEDKITFTNITNSPYYSGAKDLYNTGTSRYTADIKMDVVVDVLLNLSATITLSTVYVYKNGSALTLSYVRPDGTWDSRQAIQQTTNSDTAVLTLGDSEVYGQKLRITLEVGDYLEIYYLSSTGNPNVTGGYFKVTPIKFYDVLYETLMPNITEADFVYGLLSIFNPIIEFDSITKTLEVNLFENIKNRTPSDWSGYIKKARINYTELPSNYGRSTVLMYSGDTSEAEEYNKSSRICYGCGEIVIDNSTIQNKSDIDFVFTSSFIKNNDLFGGPLLKYDFKEFEELGDEVTISSVTNGAGIAQFDTSSSHGLRVGDWVLITTNIKNYNGYGKVSSIVDNNTFEVSNLSYESNATGTFKVVIVNDVNSDAIFLTLHVPSTSITDVSAKALIYLAGSSYTTIGYTYFDKPIIGRNIDNLKKVLSFDQPNQPNFEGGITMKQKYFRLFENILNNSPKVIAEAYIPEAVYYEFKHKTPVRYNEDIFYVNRITGYNGSHLPCEVELIKLP